jgi:hypothetical protein
MSWTCDDEPHALARPLAAAPPFPLPGATALYRRMCDKGRMTVDRSNAARYRPPSCVGQLPRHSRFGWRRHGASSCLWFFARICPVQWLRAVLTVAPVALSRLVSRGPRAVGSQGMGSLRVAASMVIG